MRSYAPATESPGLNAPSSAIIFNSNYPSGFFFPLWLPILRGFTWGFFRGSLPPIAVMMKDNQPSNIRSITINVRQCLINRQSGNHRVARL